MLKTNELIGASACLKLLFLIISIGLVNAAVLNSLNDGWSFDDDVYATDSDRISFAQGDVLDSRFTFDMSDYPDVYCLEVEVGGSSRMHDYFIDGLEYYKVGLWGYSEQDDAGVMKAIQNRGGTGGTCRFHYWMNKPSNCSDVWLAESDSAPYAAYGCAPNLTESLAEGVTDVFTFDGVDVEITCVSAMTSNFVKCQGVSSTKLYDCIDDSFNDVNGGDDYELYEACLNSDSSFSDTEQLCDIINPAVGWQLSFLDSDHLSSWREEIYSSGIPNATFNIYAYDFCGLGLFDRELVETVYLTQFQNKSVVCNDTYSYNATGYVRGFMPWYTVVNPFNNSYVYGVNTCYSPSVCLSGVETDSSSLDIDSLACVLYSGSCYDGVKNRDEGFIDYGGYCGYCDYSSPEEDLYFGIAYQSHPGGYYDVNVFNSSFDCREAEDSTGLVLVVGVLASVVLMFLSIVLVLFLLAVLGLFSLRTLFKGRKREK